MHSAAHLTLPFGTLYPRHNTVHLGTVNELRIPWPETMRPQKSRKDSHRAARLGRRCYGPHVRLRVPMGRNCTVMFALDVERNCVQTRTSAGETHGRDERVVELSKLGLDRAEYIKAFRMASFGGAAQVDEFTRDCSCQ